MWSARLPSVSFASRRHVSFFSTFGKRYRHDRIASLLLRHGEEESRDEHQLVHVMGWVKTARRMKTVSFVEMNDGSSTYNLQVVFSDTCPMPEGVATGASIACQGYLRSSSGGRQGVELHPLQVDLIGECEASAYPLQKKKHSLEHLRDIVHLRPRSTTFGAISRVRNRCMMSVHEYFQMNHFLNVHTPLLTSNDCEGAGESFRVHSESLSSDGGFFGPNADVRLTVSGQLHAELFACALSRVYTFGPCFRADPSFTPRHLAEFWMIEPEMIASTLDEVIDICQLVVQHVVKDITEKCRDELEYFESQYRPGLFDQLSLLCESDFRRLTYTEALSIIRDASLSGFAIFSCIPSWGDDLRAEHERFLCETWNNGKPVFVTHYPRSLKPFYMLSEHGSSSTISSGEVVECFDLLVPGIGELAGGSLREHRIDVLQRRLAETFDAESRAHLQWYVDLRRFGSVPHGGFGIGFERLVQLICGLDNIRDAIPVPRAAGLCRL